MEAAKKNGVEDEKDINKREPEETADQPDGNDDQGDSWGFGSSSRGIVAAMPVDKDSEYYNMQHPRRGQAIIFNHEFFDNSSLTQRSGTNVDAQNLYECLSSLGFEVTVHKDCRRIELEFALEKAQLANHSDADCFMVVVLSHGEEGVLYAKDAAYKPERLWTPFTANLCPTLAGKPKLFFIQACQGDRLDSGITLRTRSDGFGSAQQYKIPNHADFLIAYSTIPGFYSWRNTQRGSWFMQAFCQLMRTKGETEDLMRLLTRVTQAVAIDFESNSSTPHMHGQKQIPCVTTMLTRLIQFTPKQPRQI